MSDTIIGLLADAAARGRGALVFHPDSGSTERISAAELLEGAGSLASFLRARGVAPGDPVGLLGPNDAEWARWAFGVWACRATLVPIQYPLRVRDPAALAEQVASLIRAVPCRAVVAHPSLMGVLPEGLGVAWDRPGNGAGAPLTGEPDDVAVAQFTSGTTSDPRAAVITNRAVAAAIRSVAAAHALTDDDVFAGWQPLFHDLGLFGYMVRPLVLGLEGHLMPTARFARDPAEWFRLAARSRATMLGGPSSAWAAAARAVERDGTGCDLGSVRWATFSGEVAERAAVERLISAGAKFGLRPEAIAVGYGMAETTFGFTMTPPGRRPRFDEVGLRELAEEGRAVPASNGPVRSVASCGVTMPGAEVRIIDPSGDDTPERTVGEIVMRAPFLFSGYWGKDEREGFTPDGWLRSGDLGYLADGELFVTGRKKDVIVVMGRNHDPDEFEWAAGRVAGVRTGRCAAISLPDAPEGSFAIVVEPRDDADVAALPNLVRRAVIDAIGVVPTSVLVVAPGSVPKTTSGKIRRSALRDALARGSVHVISRRPPAQ